MHLAATLTTAGLLGLIYFVLSYRVIQVRVAAKITLGDGSDDKLLSRIRAHANFAEYVPLILVLMAIIELWVARGPWLWGIGAALVIGRIAHAIGMAMPAPNPFRIAGTMTTFILLIGTSVWALALGLGS
jgi:uncharacterized membrane protein YecN with MAPEG domain